MMAGAGAGSSTTAFSIVKVLGDPNSKDDLRLKAAQELTENFETITQCPGYPTFLEQSMKIFLKVLQEGDPQFISDYNIQQVCFSSKIFLPCTKYLSYSTGPEIDSRIDSSTTSLRNCSSLR